MGEMIIRKPKKEVSVVEKEYVNVKGLYAQSQLDMAQTLWNTMNNGVGKGISLSKWSKFVIIYTRSPLSNIKVFWTHKNKCRISTNYYLNKSAILE